MARVARNRGRRSCSLATESRAVLSQAARAGRAIRLGPGIYTARTSAPPEATVRRNWAQILDHELPGAIVTDRSARRSGPVDGILTVVHARKRPLDLPGLTIRPRPGSPALPGDSSHAVGQAGLARSRDARESPGPLPRSLSIACRNRDLARRHASSTRAVPTSGTFVEEAANLISIARRAGRRPGRRSSSDARRHNPVVAAVCHATGLRSVDRHPGSRARSHGVPYGRRGLGLLRGPGASPRQQRTIVTRRSARQEQDGQLALGRQTGRARSEPVESPPE